MLKLLVHLNAENMGWNPAQRSDEIQSTPAFPCVYKSFTMDPYFYLRILRNYKRIHYFRINSGTEWDREN